MILIGIPCPLEYVIDMFRYIADALEFFSDNAIGVAERLTAK